MQYKHLTDENILTGYLSRRQQLEEEHFNAAVYLEEANLIGSVQEIKDFSTKMASIELRYNVLTEKIEELQEKLSKETEETAEEAS